MQRDKENVKSIRDLYPEGIFDASFVEAVCVRPGMYTIDGTLAEVGAFLEGFYSGRGGHTSTEAGREDDTRWANFCCWACKKLIGHERGWYQLFQALRDQYPVEEDAFICLAKLCIEYRQSSDKPLR